MIGNMKGLFDLLNEEPDPSLQKQYGNRALIYAAWKGHTDMVHALCEWGVDVNHADNDGNTALMYSARWGHLAIVEQLLKFGASVDLRDKSGCTALDRAKVGNNQAVMDLLSNPKTYEI
jgi:ankyrin repeat protein